MRTLHALTRVLGAALWPAALAAVAVMFFDRAAAGTALAALLGLLALYAALRRAETALPPARGPEYPLTGDPFPPAASEDADGLGEPVA